MKTSRVAKYYSKPNVHRRYGIYDVEIVGNIWDWTSRLREQPIVLLSPVKSPMMITVHIFLPLTMSEYEGWRIIVHKFDQLYRFPRSPSQVI